MIHPATLLFKFDIHEGAVLAEKSSNCDSLLNGRQIASMKLNCFPESIISLQQGVHTFCFSIPGTESHSDNQISNRRNSSRIFCYTAFVSVKNMKCSRNFEQFSIVIATELSYYPLFIKLLSSIKSLPVLDPHDAFILLTNFVEKWSRHLPFSFKSKFELPLFDGVVPINPKPKLTHLLSTQSRFYCANLNFIGSDLITDIETDFDGALELWESAITDQPVLIEACTPQKATNAAFAIASLTYPEESPIVTPYISVIDQRFAALSERPKGIIGTSNPLAENLIKKQTKLVKIGFDLNKPSQTFNSAQIRYKLYQNTKKLRKAITEAVDQQLAGDMLAFLLGNVNVNIVTDKLIANEVLSASPVVEFAAKVLKSKLFRRICRERLALEENINRFLTLDVGDLLRPECARKVCVGLIHVMAGQTMSKDLERSLKKKLRSLASIFHSDQSSSSSSTSD
ncbi:hypothetical protein TRFO_40277 [Tritrichomonas foetus]|uniref:UDENN domain-containing protein n=1 Tax=Tritrichomonas foetus TaxID=1144522 RepID=A0A1J4J5N6_9EUKA|nr:hypothetical protein TRFO_40277 [Tritrichomonas foetus]|eukprot:OHS93455.1 hypothetical protein TRFO_40277 [Tritrichomonas foetus]